MEQLDYAPSQLFPSRCVVEKDVPIAHEDFLRLMNAPMKPNAVIKENIDKMFYDHSDDTEHCLLLTDMQTGDGIMIHSNHIKKTPRNCSYEQLRGASFWGNHNLARYYPSIAIYL